MTTTFTRRTLRRTMQRSPTATGDQASDQPDHADQPDQASYPGSTRRDDVAAAVFSTWVVVGLFLDGWAHNADKPETFWTPWHALMYSGFVAGGLWLAVDELSQRRRGTPAPRDPLVLLGFGLFAFAGVADMVWHSVFGIEKDVEALVSPSHLVLMAGGLLLVTSPVRNALARHELAPSWRSFAPAAVGITLAVAIVAFFLQFASALHVIDHDVFSGTVDDEIQVLGIVGILLANAVLLGVVTWTLRHWPSPPAGTFTLLVGGTALLMAGLDGFDQLALVAPVALAGTTADVLVHRGVGLGAVVIVVPVVLWTGWFGVYHAGWGLGWPAELWTGTIVFATLTGLALRLLASSRSPRDRWDIGNASRQGLGTVVRQP